MVFICYCCLDTGCWQRFNRAGNFFSEQHDLSGQRQVHAFPRGD
jgi:hypothetical protein